MPFEIDTGSWAMFYGKPNGLRSINRWWVFHSLGTQGALAEVLLSTY